MNVKFEYFYKQIIFIVVSLFCCTAFSANNLFVTKLNGCDPNIKDNSDLVYFDPIISDATVVGLGESTHGTKEFFQMKHRLLKYLVENKGYTLFAMEQDMTTSWQLNQFVLNGIGDPKQILMDMNAPYACQEVLDLLNWMREYNKTAQKKIQFFGFDCQNFLTPAATILNLLNQSDNKKLLNEYKIIDDTILNINKEYLYLTSAGPEPYIKIRALKFIADTKLLIQQLNLFKMQLVLNKKSLEEKLNHGNYEWLLQNVQLCKEMCSFSGLEIYEIIFKGDLTVQTVNLRDKAMAKNVIWVIQHNPNDKIVLWAHNMHIQALPELSQPQMISMGTHLKKALKDKYRTINFLTYEGTYTAVNLQTRKLDFLPLQTPPNSSLESAVDQIAFPQSLINFHDKANLPDFLTKKISYRGIGWEEEIDQFQEQTQNTSLAYDGIIYLKDTQGSHSFFGSQILPMHIFEK